MLAANPISSPMSASTKLSKFDSPSFHDVTLFRSTVGSPQYLSLMQPDVLFAINKVYQFINDSKLTHWIAVKRIMRYFKATINYGLFLCKHSSLKLHAYFDTDWAGCLDD